MERVRRVWGVCLIVIGLTAVLRLADLPDAAVRALGIADLLALPVLGYTSVRLLREPKGGK